METVFEYHVFAIMGNSTLRLFDVDQLLEKIWSVKVNSHQLKLLR